MLSFIRSYLWILIGGVFIGIALASLSSTNVEAQKRPIRFSKKSLPQKNKRLTAIVMDANTGQILYEENAFSPRCPASTIKLLTIYIVFSELKRGKLRLTDQLKISENAARQKPSKMWLKTGNTISVRDAIFGALLKSANDAAVVLGETIAGTERKFAELMTHTAQKLGLRKTICINASGWPDNVHGFVDPKQISTAEDLAKLSRALIKEFPQYYKFFSTPKFVYRGTTFVNSNPLLKKKKGVDGLKTGYGGGAVGFNFVTSEKRGKNRIIAVVMGARTPQERNQKARALLDKGFDLLEKKSKSFPLKKQKDIPLKESSEALSSEEDIFNFNDLQEIFKETPAAPFPSFPEKSLPPEFEETLSSFLEEEISSSLQPLSNSEISEEKILREEPEPETQTNPLEKNRAQEISIDTFEQDFSETFTSPETSINLPSLKTKKQTPPLTEKLPQKLPFGKTQDLPSFKEDASDIPEIELPKILQKKKADHPRPISQKENPAALKNWHIQVATLPTSLKAKEEGKKLTRAFPKILKINQLKILKTETKRHKKNFSVRFLGFSKKEAQKACRTLLSQKKQCVVIEP